MADNIFSKELLAEGRIVCYRFISTGQEAAEKWAADVTNLIAGWDASKPLLLLLDLCQAKNLLSADMLFSASSASHERADVVGKTAVLVLGSAPSKGVQMLLDRGALANTRERKIFDDEAEGIAWLLETAQH
jgi:hypothetical protein